MKTNQGPFAISTPDAPAPGGFYSQAVKAGDFVFVAGQLPLDASGRLVAGSPTEQTIAALENVRNILTAAGTSIANLVQVTVYVADIAHWPQVNAAYAQLLGDVTVPPARAVVPVKELHYGALVEIQAVAYVGR